MQPVSGLQWSNIAATVAATATLFSGACTLVRVIFPANATGTVTFYDSASGTTATSLAALPCTSGSIPSSIEIGAQMKTGLTYTSGGTSNMIVLYR